MPYFAGAPEEIRTPDPQIRSLVPYPPEPRARRLAVRGLGSQLGARAAFRSIPRSVAGLPTPHIRYLQRDGTTRDGVRGDARRLSSAEMTLSWISRRVASSKMRRQPASRSALACRALGSAAFTNERLRIDREAPDFPQESAFAILQGKIRDRTFES